MAPRTLTKAQQMMVEDGLPVSTILTDEERRQARENRKTMIGAIPALASCEKENDMTKKAKVSTAKKVMKKAPKASKPQKTSPQTAEAKEKAACTKTPRASSKVEIIANLLKRPGGCTTKDVLDATKWPSVSMPQQARAAGLTLQKEKKDGVTVYRATKAA